MSGSTWQRMGMHITAALALFVFAFAQAAPPAPVEGGFTLVVVPDTQNYTWKRPELYALQAGWIAANVRRYNIAHVLHVGDITQHNNMEEWSAARRAQSLYSDLVPAAYAAGNHDFGPNGNTETRGSLFADYISFADYRRRPGFGGVYDREPDRTENSYHLFDGGGRQWLILVLEFAPRDDVVRWANDIVTRHPRLGVILLTHAYLAADGTRFDGKKQSHGPAFYPLAGSSDGSNDGEALWQKLVSRHPNFALVISGHVGVAAYLESKGVNGNSVHQLVVDYQDIENGGNAWLRLLQFLPDGKTVRVRDYTPLLDQTSKSRECAFEFVLDPASFDGQ
jgi:hypothetical protein